MQDISGHPNDELDGLLLSLANPYWRKVAAIIGQAIIADKDEQWDENTMGDPLLRWWMPASSTAPGMSAIGDSEVRLPSRT